MSNKIDLIYNETIANEKLKNGTKYERLAGIVFLDLYEKMGERVKLDLDLKLTGPGKKSKHQIDVRIRNIENDEIVKQILIECKDFEKKKVVRDVVEKFKSVVNQLLPDDAFVVSTIGFTKPAITFALEENIKLFNLKAMDEKDWDGRIRDIFSSKLLDCSVLVGITLIPSHESVTNLTGIEKVDEMFLSDGMGEKYLIQEYIKLNKATEIRELENDETLLIFIFSDEKFIEYNGIILPIKGFVSKYEHYYFDSTSHINGDKISRLILKSLDGTIDSIICKGDLVKNRGLIGQKK